MKIKARLLVCYLLVCCLVPIHFAFAAIPIDRNGNGIHIDDIVYYLSQTGSPSRSDLTHLFNLIAPKSPALNVLAAPTNLVSTAGNSKINLTWSSVTGATYYNVYQSQDNLTYHLISAPATVTSATYEVTGLTNGILYYFKTSSAKTGAESTYSNVVGAIPVPTPILRSGINVALASNGGTASASTTIANNFPQSSINNGDRRGFNWGNGGGWNDGTPNAYPDWIQIDFNGSKTIHEIDVYTIQDNFNNPSEPTTDMTFSQYGITDYIVQYWNGSNWVNVTDGSVTANNKVWMPFTFLPVITNKIRVTINNAQSGFSRVIELEAWAGF